jgi:hypothetical protein
MSPKRWRHVILNTRCSWLHGDERGFRSRGHRIHSSGDYRHRPPVTEHAGLRQYHQDRSGAPVSFSQEVRIIILREFVLKMRSLNHGIKTCSVGEQHLHAVPELPFDYELMKREVGKCKQKASHAVRELLPGSIWSEGGTFKEFTDDSHLDNTFDYIRLKQEAGTIVWSQLDEENWIDHPEVGVIVMAPGRERMRIYS